jgi:HK97 family phage major capsid protein
MLDTRARPAEALPTAPPEAVLKRGYLPPDVNLGNSDLRFYINEFPMGDIENYSVARAAYAMAQEKQGHQSAWQKYAPWERAYQQALTKAMGDQVSGLDGAYLAPEVWGTRLFDLLRSFSALDQLPITRIRVPVRTLRLPKISGDITIRYPGENASITESQYSFGQLAYNGHKANAFYNESNEMFRDVPEVIDQALQLSASKAIATDRDTQAFTGIGGPKPVGIVNLPQVSVYYPGASASAAIVTTAAHATPSYNHLSQLRGKVTSLNGASTVTAGQAECDGIVVHSRFEQTVMTLGTAAGAWTDAQGRPLWTMGLNGETSDPQTGLLGMRWALTNVLPTNLAVAGGSASSYAIAGWWAQYVLFECQTFTFDATPYAQGFASDQTQIRLTYRYDCAPARPEAFAVLAGVDQ